MFIKNGEKKSSIVPKRGWGGGVRARGPYYNKSDNEITRTRARGTLVCGGGEMGREPISHIFCKVFENINSQIKSCSINFKMFCC